VAFEDAAGCPACLSPPGRRGEEEMRKKVNEEAMLEQRAKEEALKNEALGFYRLIRQQFGLKPFVGVTIDLHAKKQAVVFDPKTETLTTVENGELTHFLKSLNVRRVLIDALFPSNAEILIDISNAGMEVYFLRRTSAPKLFKKFVKRKAEKLKLEIAIPKKNDYVDAVILSLIKPKFLQKVDADYLTCWQKMVDWRNVNEASMYLQTNFKKKTKLVNLLKETDQLQKEMAKEFVETVKRYYPEVMEHFKKLGITEDVVTQAYYCEVLLEMLPCEKFHQVLKKAGIDVSQRAHKRLEQRQKDGEEQDKKFVYDGKFAYALNQLTLKTRKLNPYNKKHRQIILIASILLAKEIWLMANAEKGDGRVGEALGWRAGPSRKRGLGLFDPPLRGACEKQE
jgi:L-rhamnose mutarotase